MKASTLRNESLSLGFLQNEILEFLEVYMNRRSFHKKGMLFSHIVTRFRKFKLVEVDIFMYDPTIARHAKPFLRGIVGRSFIPKKIHKKRHIIRKACKFFPHLYRLRLIRNIRKYRGRLYGTIIRFMRSKFKKVFPTLDFKLRFIPIHAHMLNAEFLGRYFLMKFQYRRDVVKVINPISHRLRRRFRGVRIDCAGRFNRRQRASFFHFQRGRVPLNSFSSRLDYAQVSLPLKYGACSIKIWVADRRSALGFGSELNIDKVNSLNVATNLPVQQSNTFRYSLLRDQNNEEQELSFNTPYVPMNKVIKVGEIGKHRYIPKRRPKALFLGTQFYNRRSKIGKFFLSAFNKPIRLPKDLKHKFLDRLLKPRSPGWFRQAMPKYKFPTTRELNKGVQKEMAKVHKRNRSYILKARFDLRALLKDYKWNVFNKLDKSKFMKTGLNILNKSKLDENKGGLKPVRKIALKNEKKKRLEKK